MLSHDANFTAYFPSLICDSLDGPNLSVILAKYDLCTISVLTHLSLSWGLFFKSGAFVVKRLHTFWQSFLNYCMFAIFFSIVCYFFVLYSYTLSHTCFLRNKNSIGIFVILSTTSWRCLLEYRNKKLAWVENIWTDKYTWYTYILWWYPLHMWDI